MMSQATVIEDVSGKHNCAVCGEDSEMCQKVTYVGDGPVEKRVAYECAECRKAQRRRNAKRADGNFQAQMV